MHKRDDTPRRIIRTRPCDIALRERQKAERKALREAADKAVDLTKPAKVNKKAPGAKRKW